MNKLLFCILLAFSFNALAFENNIIEKNNDDWVYQIDYQQVRNSLTKYLNCKDVKCSCNKNSNDDKATHCEQNRCCKESNEYNIELDCLDDKCCPTFNENEMLIHAMVSKLSHIMRDKTTAIQLIKNCITPRNIKKIQSMTTKTQVIQEYFKYRVRQNQFHKIREMSAEIQIILDSQPQTITDRKIHIDFLLNLVKIYIEQYQVDKDCLVRQDALFSSPECTSRQDGILYDKLKNRQKLNIKQMTDEWEQEIKKHLQRKDNPIYQAQEILQKAYRILSNQPTNYFKANQLLELAKQGLELEQQAQELEKQAKFNLSFLNKKIFPEILQEAKTHQFPKYFVSNIYGYYGKLYLSHQRYKDALKLTNLAIAYSSSKTANDYLYIWKWQKAQVIEETCSKTNSCTLELCDGRYNNACWYRKAIEAMKSVQHKLTAQDIQPLYRQLISAKWDEYLKQKNQETLKEIIQIVEELNIKEVSLYYQISDCAATQDCEKLKRKRTTKPDEKCPIAQDVQNARFNEIKCQYKCELGVQEEIRQDRKRKKECEQEFKSMDNVLVTTDEKLRALFKNNPKAVLYYPIVLEDKLLLLLVTGTKGGDYTISPLSSKEAKDEALPIPQTILDAILLEFRFKMMRKLDNEHLILAQFLYEKLITPFESELHKIDTLVVVPTGYFRMIPLEVLNNPKTEKYLVERKNLGIVYTVAATQLDFEKYTRNKLNKPAALIAGTSESNHEHFANLEVIKDELDAIKTVFKSYKKQVKPIYLREQNFTKTLVKKNVRQYTPEIIHFASHSGFYANPENSFILTHYADIENENLNIHTDDLEKIVSPVIGSLAPNQKLREAKHLVDLLVLSACETAYGDEDSALGLAGITVKSGAKSAIASLWAVEDDPSIPFLMKEFYQEYLAGKYVTTKFNKAQALQKAKQALIQRAKQDDRYYYQSYPFYWAPFIMIGNGF